MGVEWSCYIKNTIKIHVKYYIFYRIGGLNVLDRGSFGVSSRKGAVPKVIFQTPPPSGYSSINRGRVEILLSLVKSPDPLCL